MMTFDDDRSYLIDVAVHGQIGISSIIRTTNTTLNCRLLQGQILVTFTYKTYQNDHAQGAYRNVEPSHVADSRLSSCRIP